MGELDVSNHQIFIRFLGNLQTKLKQRFQKFYTYMSQKQK